MKRFSSFLLALMLLFSLSACGEGGLNLNPGENNEDSDARFGYVGDMEVDLETGQVRALVVPGRRRFFGLLGREEDKVIPWGAVKRFGEDIILVEQ